ncbi:SAV0927 family protein [Gracilibacillus sp. YIM 98692]|uniref:SAV0927 family protein n=1 Tax=Gracilibacillus sp. YIM 98692 TaxID=2663532 RepID=UPI001F09CC29|nr:SAV0927 family protein [Gracilibacillus sp. YIM 98692]
MSKINYLKNTDEQATTKFVSFKGDTHLFDLAIIDTPSIKPDLLIVDLNTNKYLKVDKERISEENIVEHALQYNEMDAEDFRRCVIPLLKS